MNARRGLWCERGLLDNWFAIITEQWNIKLIDARFNYMTRNELQNAQSQMNCIESPIKVIDQF